MVIQPRTASVAEQDVDQLAGRYVLRDAPAVAAFLRHHPDVVATLLAAEDVVTDYFPESGPMILEVVRDPEAGDEVELYARIPTALDVDAALERLRAFDEGWWLDALPNVANTLTFTIEYV